MGFHSTKAYVGMRPHTYHTRSRAWASVHHIGTSRVHWSHSAPPLSRRTHPPLPAGSALHPQSASHFLPPMCARTPPSASGGLGSLLPPYCACTTGSFKSRNLYKPIYFETADYGCQSGRGEVNKAIHDMRHVQHLTGSSWVIYGHKSN